ncbi:MAG: ImmA/IrrE family metallo-endopeptidase [Ignavibacteriae bacterium]|nr:ImmA/IrrE family metallo-endopeptidase [Ignavibacteriota bacterium]
MEENNYIKDTINIYRSNLMKIWKNKSVLLMMEEEGSNDPIELIKERARSLITTAIDKGWHGPPYNPIELARQLKIDITPNDNVIDARTIPTGKNKFLIEYNPFDRASRINFSIAHELGHFLFSDCSDEIRNRENKEVKKKDKEKWELELLCNIAASEILLPYGSFIEDANKTELTLKGLIELADKYKASLEAVMLRFTEVVSKPCGISIATFVEDELIVDYSKTSRTLKIDIPKGYRIPKNSEAFACIYPGKTSSEQVSWQVFGSNRMKISFIGLPPLPGQMNRRVGVFLVPFQDGEVQDNKIRIEFGDARDPLGQGTKIIAQLVNTSGGVGFGFGRAMASTWPDTKRALQNWKRNSSEFRLGKSQLLEVERNIFVFQMLAQLGIHGKKGEIPLKYSALRMCLKDLAEIASQKNASIHMPQIGAGQAGGNWEIIQELIYTELVSKGINVTVYLLPGKISKPVFRSTLSLFDEESLWQKEN